MKRLCDNVTICTCVPELDMICSIGYSRPSLSLPSSYRKSTEQIKIIVLPMRFIKNQNLCEIPLKFRNKLHLIALDQWENLYKMIQWVSGAI